MLVGGGRQSLSTDVLGFGLGERTLDLQVVGNHVTSSGLDRHNVQQQKSLIVKLLGFARRMQVKGSFRGVQIRPVLDRLRLVQS